MAHGRVMTGQFWRHFFATLQGLSSTRRTWIKRAEPFVFVVIYSRCIISVKNKEDNQFFTPALNSAPPQHLNLDRSTVGALSCRDRWDIFAPMHFTRHCSFAISNPSSLLESGQSLSLFSPNQRQKKTKFTKLFLKFGGVLILEEKYFKWDLYKTMYKIWDIFVNILQRYPYAHHHYLFTFFLIGLRASSRAKPHYILV
jgi:hypothetical protein